LGIAFECALEDTFSARSYCPSADLLAGLEGPRYEECLSVLTGPHANGIPLDRSSSERTESTSLGPISPFPRGPNGYSQSLPITFANGDGSTNTQSPDQIFEQGLPSFNRTSTNSFPETEFDLNYDYTNSNDPFFRPDYLSVPILLFTHESFTGD
jgi:hypothetical protein